MLECPKCHTEGLYPWSSVTNSQELERACIKCGYIEIKPKPLKAKEVYVEKEFKVRLLRKEFRYD